MKSMQISHFWRITQRLVLVAADKAFTAFAACVQANMGRGDDMRILTKSFLCLLAMTINFMSGTVQASSGAFVPGSLKWEHETVHGDCYSAIVRDVEAEPNQIEIIGAHDAGPYGIQITWDGAKFTTGHFGQYMAKSSSVLQRDGRNLWVKVKLTTNHTSTCNIELKLIEVLVPTHSAYISMTSRNADPLTSASEPSTDDASNLENAKAQCHEIGFTEGTEKYADCVMRLLK